jgi:hypothetical protein
MSVLFVAMGDRLGVGRDRLIEGPWPPMDDAPLPWMIDCSSQLSATVDISSALLGIDMSWNVVAEEVRRPPSDLCHFPRPDEL